MIEPKPEKYHEHWEIDINDARIPYGSQETRIDQAKRCYENQETRIDQARKHDENREALIDRASEITPRLTRQAKKTLQFWRTRVDQAKNALKNVWKPTGGKSILFNRCWLHFLLPRTTKKGQRCTKKLRFF